MTASDSESASGKSMLIQWNVREHVTLARFSLKWILITIPVAFIIGSACSLFLWLLEWATRTRIDHPVLLYFLPLAGVAIILAYQAAGKSIDLGNNLVLDEIHEPGAGVPLRMTPLVLICTVVTHLFGGSAGREGTAVQMGGSIASKIARVLRLRDVDQRMLMMAGVAAGFGAVFGTPVTGAIFAMEVLALGRIRYDAVGPCLIGAITADWACSLWGTRHTHYSIQAVSLQGMISSYTRFNEVLLVKAAVAAVAFGLVSFLFAEVAHGLQAGFKRFVGQPLLRPVVGAAAVIALVHVLGTRDYLGLGVTSPEPGGVSIVSAFQSGGSHSFSWLWKLIFTTVTLSAGFKGGEVTPLFFIGATLGNTLAVLMGAPVDLFAGLGFIAVFAGATNTPLACTIMGIELFGAQHAVYFAVACFVAYLFSGHSGIYLSQKISTPKLGEGRGENLSLRNIRENLTRGPKGTRE